VTDGNDYWRSMATNYWQPAGDQLVIDGDDYWRPMAMNTGD
jgi:hypothetical protein